ncbi:hypothetical protein Vadar_032774 [Vaccinium darrowii]|uniref:Uncharacterized protein n=1 Tax=Vaccinium darrowii TaxID=229202 RepID=A0ACB7X6D6_9ERIC|nr:hypothetical protein Vadar_032774 [Vaccinium darrowii]
MDVEVGPLSPIFNSVLSPPIAPVVNKKRGRGRGAWNIRGLNDPLKQKEVLSFIRSQKLSLVGIVEIKVRLENFDKTVRFCFPAKWASIHNGSNDRVSRIIVAWNALDVTVDIFFPSPQLVVVKVLSADKKLFYVSFVYGHNSVVDRRSLWNDMNTMALCIVWSSMLQKNGIDRPPLNLDLERDWVCSNKAGNSYSNIVYKLSLAASIYRLWRREIVGYFSKKWFLLQLFLFS